MANAFRNKHFVARFRDNLFFADGKLEPSFHHGHHLVRRVYEIVPLPTGRVGEQVAGEAAPAPILSYLITVERNREFLMSEVGWSHVMDESLFKCLMRCTIQRSLY